MNRSPIRQPQPRRRPAKPLPVLAAAPTVPPARTPLFDPGSPCKIRWPDCDGLCRGHPSPVELAAQTYPTQGRLPVLSELVELASHDLAIYRTLVDNPTIPDWVFSTLLARLADDSYRSVVPADIDQRFSIALASPRTKKAELRRLARITAISDISLLELLSHRACDPTVTAVTALALGRLETPHALTLRTTVRQFGTDTARACLVMAHFEAPLPTHTDPKTFAVRTRSLISASNKLLNRFNHCRPLALEVIESLIEGWSGTAQDLADVATALLASRHSY